MEHADLAGGPSEAEFAAARAQFPVLERIAYLNAGTFGPLARATLRALEHELAHDGREGRTGGPWFERVLARREDLRSSLAALIDADPARIALTNSTTESCNIVVGGLRLGRGDRVVTTNAEHPGLLLPLHTSGAEVVVVPPDADAIVAAVDGRTRLVAVSQVLWTDGTVLPVRAIRAAIDVPILVDGAQLVGAIPVDSEGLDFLTISGQKWLCGPDATGALYVRDPEALAVTKPSYLSKVTSELDGSFVPRPGAARFDPEWWSGGTLEGMLAALAERPAWWHARADAAAQLCRTLLAAEHEVVTPPVVSTLVSFVPRGGASAETVAALYAAGVHVREIPGTGLVRVSCGWWTSDGDLERLVEALG